MTLRARWLCTGVLAGTVGVVMVAALAFETWKWPVIAGCGSALALVLPSYWTLSWAHARSDKVFYSVYSGGLLFRLAGIAGLGGWIYHHTGLSLPTALVSCVSTLTLLSFIEVYFIAKEGRSSFEFHRAS